MTRPDLAALEALEAKAAPAPWGLNHYIPQQSMTGSNNPWYTDIVHKGKELCKFLDWRQNRASNDPGESPNASLITAVRNALPALIRTIRQQDAEIARLKGGR